MKKLLLTLCIFAITAIVILLINACQKQENEIANKQTELKTSYPERPTINAGESNWNASKSNTKSTKSILTTDLNVLTPTDLVNALIGSSSNAPTVSNISYNGAAIAAGTFSGGLDAIGFENGIILSSGNIASVVGPNIADGTSTNNGLAGDPDLDALIPGYATFDATILEFDFECTELQVISFQYVFTSEEYNEYVNSAFNDVFGFFVNGVNIALIPGTSTPVSINNINCGNPYNPPSGGSYCEYFRNNDLSDGGGSIDTEMDGLTIVFYATANVNPGLNHIKLAIADAGDRVLDSDVFIKGESFVCEPPPPEYIEVSFDIKPGSCPNPFNPKGNGVLPVAILGESDFDVSQIDVSTITIAGISPVKASIEDVATPYTAPLMDCYSCNQLGMDGYMDLSLKFNTQALAAALSPLSVGDCITIEINGYLYDGTPIKGFDPIIIVGKLPSPSSLNTDN
jgi:hypothetical protein